MQGLIITDSFDCYRLELAVDLTEEEGDQMVHQLCQSPYFIFALFALLTSLLIKYLHSHPLYYLRYLRYFAIFICLAQCHQSPPYLLFPLYKLKNTLKDKK